MGVNSNATESFNWATTPSFVNRARPNIYISSQSEIIAWCFFYSLVGTVTIFGNSLTIAVFLKRNFNRKKLYYILINLAITDLSVGALSVPLQIRRLVSSRSETAFVAHYFLDVLSGLTSMYSIAFISVERLIAVACPLQYRLLRTWHYAIAISLTWLIAATVAILTSKHILPEALPPLTALNIRIVFAMLPIFVTIITYCALWYTRQHSGAKEWFANKQYNKRLSSMLLIVTIIFFFTWTPFIVFSSTITYLLILNNRFPDISHKTLVYVTYLTKLLQYSNSCVNPFIYTLKIPAFRVELLKILKLFNNKIKRRTISTSSYAGEFDKRYVSEYTTCGTPKHSVKFRNRTLSSTNEAKAMIQVQ